MLRGDFKYLLKDKILIIDGGLSSEIQRRLKEPHPFPPRFLLDHEKLVQQIHKDFADAGAGLMVTGTAEANRLALQLGQIKSRLEEINAKAVAVCRNALPPDGLMFGGLGPTGALLKPYGRLTEEDYRAVYVEQAKCLIQEGVDGFILEGFSSLIEAEQCVAAVRESCSAPIIATMTFLEDGLTKFGDTIEDCFQSLQRAGADLVGIHGTLGPLEIDDFLGRLKKPYPLCVRPNAGYPVRIGNTTTYLSSPEYVAECAELFVDRGALIIGGAAGFSPDHIREIANRLRGRAPKLPEPAAPRVSRGASALTGEAPAKQPPEKTLRQKLGKEPIITVELEPPKGLETEGLMRLLDGLLPYGIDAVNIPENPLARARISSIALAKAIHERLGLESITHITCRDRNLISLQAELLGAHVLGVNTILALTGDPASVGDYPSATSVFDVDSLGLVEIMARMNIGKDFGMNDLGATTRFNIGVAANPLAEDLQAELERVETKIKRGATFVQTQPIFDPGKTRPFLKALADYKVPVIFGVMFVRDYRHAKFLVNEYPGIHIKDKDLERFRRQDPKMQRTLSTTFACELIQELSDLSGGVYLMPAFGEQEWLIETMDRLRNQ